MIIKKMNDHYEVLFNHIVVLSIDNTINNFREYLAGIEQEFNKELNKTLFSMANVDFKKTNT